MAPLAAPVILPVRAHALEKRCPLCTGVADHDAVSAQASFTAPYPKPSQRGKGK
jgi:hypothetical protein